MRLSSESEKKEIAAATELFPICRGGASTGITKRNRIVSTLGDKSPDDPTCAGEFRSARMVDTTGVDELAKGIAWLAPRRKLRAI